MNYSELKRLAEAATPDEASPYLPCQVAFMNAATPAAVLALIAENERLRLALKSAEDAMWKAESNMDNEAADIRDLLAAMSQGEQA